jgi:hypothetical protein
MNEFRQYQELLEQVANLTQAVSELARQQIKICDGILTDRETAMWTDWALILEQLTGSNEAIINKLRAVHFCDECHSPIVYRSLPCWKKAGVCCHCPDKPALNLSTLTAQPEEGGEPVTLNDWPIGFIPPDWFAPKPSEGAVVGQSAINQKD